MKKLLLLTSLFILSCEKEEKPILIGKSCEELQVELNNAYYSKDSILNVYTGPDAGYTYIDTTKGYDDEGTWYFKEPYQTEYDKINNRCKDITSKMEEKGC